MTTATAAKLTMENELLKFTFLSSGDLYEASGQGMMINQLLSNPIDGSLSNIYLRVHQQDGIHSYPLLGVQSRSLVRKYKDHMTWEGEVGAKDTDKVRYQVRFTLAEQGIWFWDIQLEGHDVQVDLIYGQDIGIADPGAVRSNEAYLSQYIDHNVFEDDKLGYVVCSRQNQPQGGKFPYIQQGSLTKAVGYSTDGFQFFGLSYKETNEPAILSQQGLANDTYQYEFAYTALQSGRVHLSGQASFNFYGLFRQNHPSATSELEYTDVIRKVWHEVQATAKTPQEAPDSLAQVSRLLKVGEPLNVLPLEQDELSRLFPERRQEEYDGDTLLSFFTPTYEHVIMKAKELRVERPHGHILMSGDNARMNDQVITTTSYMYGIFNSQLVVGNTNFNKMMTNARNALNIPKTSGQRIYVEMDGQFRLLTMPSLFEIGFNYVRWYYKTASDMLIITNYTTVDSPEVRLRVRSVSGKAYRYLVTNQISMNVGEYEVPYHMQQQDGVLVFGADQSSISSEYYPSLAYRMVVDGTSCKIQDEQALVSGDVQGSASLVVLELEPSEEWTIIIQGLIQGGDLKTEPRDFEREVENYRMFYASVMNGFRLSRAGEEGDLFKVNALAWWYTHNMLVHYSVPHGLEQYGGAAWGTRDVCQGPAEYFMATHKYEQVRDILLTVYAHQYEDDGNWPQWFMFDKYAKIQQEESHGDIIVWPLKVLSDYLTATKDFDILDELVPYTRKHSFDFTETQPLREHVHKELNYIQEHFLHDTYLSSYGDGDWDDTLQPANEQLKQYMVSSWTVALTYQAIRQLSEVLQEADPDMAVGLGQLSEGIQSDFHEYMLGTGVIPGFVYLENPEDARLMVHPTDQETGIQYRLLPMTRSMISELLTPEQAESHYELIQANLWCPDGVRLMNRPAQYTGGVSIHFKRAEQAANFGREIGLQYVHAHIRYVEAMAKLGKRDQVWNGLAAINPIGIQDVVPNAELRQSNAYFSSSDGKFATRYEAQQRFGELKDGSVAVKGGWRIYSSGPGIYMNQLISNALGIREEGGDLVIDPVLPAELDGLRFEFEYGGQPVTFLYHYTDGVVRRVTVGGQEVPAELTANRYRSGGLRIRRADLDRIRPAQDVEIEVFM